MVELTPVLVAILVFASVTVIVFIVGRYIASQAVIYRRLPAAASTHLRYGLSERVPDFFLGSLAGKVDEKKFGIEGQIRTKLRRDLVRAGYFSDLAIRGYILARLALVIILPAIVFILIEIFLGDALDFYLELLAVSVAAFAAIIGPDAYISRRQRVLQREYQLVFPDLIDMLVVCADAGLSLDAAFARIQPEVAKESRALGMNLTILGAETRAGRTVADALGTFADRLNIDEARAFVILLRQSLELGTDIGDALRVFSDEMRTKRLLRAEETANKLPVKMVIPLGALIFPVILMVVMVPVLMRLFSIMQQTTH